jgi:hypothetical protein
MMVVWLYYCGTLACALLGVYAMMAVKEATAPWGSVLSILAGSLTLVGAMAVLPYALMLAWLACVQVTSPKPGVAAAAAQRRKRPTNRW